MRAVPTLAIGEPSQMSLIGKWATLISALFVFSISSVFRLNFGGFLIHPYLLMLPIAILASGFRIFTISNRVLVPLMLFYLVFSIACLQNENPLEEIIKVGASLLTFLFFAVSVRTEKDFRMIVIGFVICAVVIGYLGFGKGEEGTEHRLSGINALEGIGNKNAQSLYTLPGIFFTILLVIQYLRAKRYLVVTLLVVFLFFMVIGVFLSANRSGWVGLLIIAFTYLVYLRFKSSTLIVFSLLAVFSYVAINKYASDIVEHKINKTVEGYQSDDGRIILMKESLRTGLENPVLGVGKDELHKRMSKAVRMPSVQAGVMDTHFLTGYLFGATGIFSVIMFYSFLYQLTRKQYTLKYRVSSEGSLRILVVSFVILFFIRSFFTREILYSPTFMGGLGLLYSYYQLKIRSVGK